jgi:hypothetical protein
MGVSTEKTYQRVNENLSARCQYLAINIASDENDLKKRMKERKIKESRQYCN